MSLAKKIALVTSGAVSFLVIATLVVLNFHIRESIELKVRSDLAGSKTTFESFLKERFEALFVNASIVADTPRFKSLLETRGIDHDTVLYSLQEMQKIVKCDLLTATDAGGKVLARVSHPFWYGDDLSSDTAVSSALSGRRKASLLFDGSKVYQVVTLPVVTQDVIQGTLTAGFVIDQDFADRFFEMTSGGLGLVFDGKVAVSSGSGSEKADFEQIAAKYASTFGKGSSVPPPPHPVLFSVRGGTLLAVVAPLESGYRSEGAFYVIKISLTEAIAFYRDRIQSILILLGMLAILVSMLAGIAIARRIARPILVLKHATEQYAGGDLECRVPVKSKDEVGVLGAAFNRMAADLGATTHSLIAARDLLESKVEMRTRELASANQQLQEGIAGLERQNREMMLLGEMDDVLQACASVEELYAIAGQLMKKMFPGWAGGISSIKPSTLPLEVAASWGSPIFKGPLVMPQECVALRLGRMHFVEKSDSAVVLCRHFQDPSPSAFVCVPLTATKITFGILHLVPPAGEILTKDRQRFIGTIARHMSLALANLMLREKLQSESIRDPLTGLYNRRYMEEALATEITRSRRSSRHIGVVMMDIDHFKVINDTNGHDAGDLILSTLARELGERLRGGDILCRYGGEEFILIMPDVTVETLRAKALDLWRKVKDTGIAINGAGAKKFSMSFGLAMFPDHGNDAKSLVRAADQALYQSKLSGRDCIHFALAEGGAVKVSA